MNANIQTIQDTLPTVPKQTSAQEIVSLMNQYGGVRIKNYLTQEQVANINREVDAPLERLREGSSHDNELIKEFHGTYTKRLTNMVTHSKTFGDVLDDELFHEPARCSTAKSPATGGFRPRRSSTSARATRHRCCIATSAIFRPCARSASTGRRYSPTSIALTRFTEENGATRIIPGSQNWDEDYFDSKGTPDMTIAAEMDAGDALLFSGKVIHGGGANVTKNERRRAHDSDATVLPDAGGSVSLHRRDGHREAPVETRSTNHRLPLAISGRHAGPGKSTTTISRRISVSEPRTDACIRPGGPPSTDSVMHMRGPRQHHRQRDTP